MALLLLGSLLWGASIFLIGQMYHMGSRAGGNGEKEAVLYWFLGVLPLAYIIRSPLHLALSLVTGTVWLGMVMQIMPGPPPQTYPLAMLALGMVLYVLARLHAETARHSATRAAARPASRSTSSHSTPRPDSSSARPIS